MLSVDDELMIIWFSAVAKAKEAALIIIPSRILHLVDVDGKSGGLLEGAPLVDEAFPLHLLWVDVLQTVPLHHLPRALVLQHLLASLPRQRIPLHIVGEPRNRFVAHTNNYFIILIYYLNYNRPRFK